MMKWAKDEDTGVVTCACTDCGKIYEMTSEWDKANLDWHNCS